MIPSMRYSGQLRPQREKVECKSPGAEVGEWDFIVEWGQSFTFTRKVMETNSGDGCTTL